MTDSNPSAGAVEAARRTLVYLRSIGLDNAEEEDIAAIVADLWGPLVLERDAARAAARELGRAMLALEPHFDAIVCYASTAKEFEPNRLVANWRRMLTKHAALLTDREDES